LRFLNQFRRIFAIESKYPFRVDYFPITIDKEQMSMKTISKIGLAATAVVVIAAIVAAIFWFSMPSEQRNMVVFQMTKGPSYEHYQEYQTIDKNKSAPLPTSFKSIVAETTTNDYNSNITVITEMVLNEKSRMFKKAMVQPNGANPYLGWQLIADESFDEGADSFGPSPLSYLTSGAAANLHTQILRAAKVMNIELDNVKVEVLNKFRWKNMMSAEALGFVDKTHANIIIESSESEETIRNLKEKSLDAVSNLTFEILAISESAQNSDRPYLKKITVSFNTPNSETWEIYSDELNGTEGSPIAPTSLEYLTAGVALCLTSQVTLVCAMLDMDYTDFRVEQQIEYREEAVNSTAMAGFTDIIHTSVMIESDESEERLNRFFQQSLSMCFAGQGMLKATPTKINLYQNRKLVQ